MEYPIEYLIEFPMEYHLGYPVLEYLTEDCLCVVLVFRKRSGLIPPKFPETTPFGTFDAIELSLLVVSTCNGY